MIEILIEPFKYEFMTRSIITAIASGVMLSLLGPFAINRNMGFMADAMAHATLPIIAVGVFLGFIGAIMLIIYGSNTKVINAPNISFVNCSLSAPDDKFDFKSP